MTFRTFALAVAVALGAAIGTPAAAATLVAHYTFSNATDLGADSSGYGNNASVSSVVQTAGPAGQFAALFDKDASVFQVLGGLNGYTGAPGFSFVTWVKVTADTGYEGLITQDYTETCCIDRLLLQEGDQPYFNGGQHVDEAVTQTYPIGTWYQVALTANTVAGGSVDDVYVDGTLAGTFNFTYATPSLSGENTSIGAGDHDGAYRLDGALSDVRIYQGALTAQEVLGLYDGASAASSAPEPAAWALMVVGFGGLGACFRLRRRGSEPRPVRRRMDGKMARKNLIAGSALIAARCCQCNGNLSPPAATPTTHAWL